QAEDGIRDRNVTGVQTCALPIFVTLGSLGEGATLTFEEKIAVLRNCVRAVNGRAPVVASVSALTTSEAVSLAKAAADAGCDALRSEERRVGKVGAVGWVWSKGKR